MVVGHDNNILHSLCIYYVELLNTSFRRRSRYTVWWSKRFEKFFYIKVTVGSNMDIISMLTVTTMKISIFLKINTYSFVYNYCPSVTKAAVFLYMTLLMESYTRRKFLHSRRWIMNSGTLSYHPTIFLDAQKT
jgi:hypothetical protein